MVEEGCGEEVPVLAPLGTMVMGATGVLGTSGEEKVNSGVD